MNSIQTNPPVLARALDYNQEAKRKLEVQQQVAAKPDTGATGQRAYPEQATNRVVFSQEAQIKLGAEKSRDANRVEAVRVADEIKASEARNRAISQENFKAAESRDDSLRLSEQRKNAAQASAEVAARAAAGDRKAADAKDQATRKVVETETAKSVAQQTRAQKEVADQAQVAIRVRTEGDRVKEVHKLAANNDATNLASRREEAKRNNGASDRNASTLDAAVEQLKAKTAKAVEMYRKVSGMG